MMVFKTSLSVQSKALSTILQQPKRKISRPPLSPPSLLQLSHSKHLQNTHHSPTFPPKTPIKMQSALYSPPPSLPFFLTSNPTKPFSPKISFSKLHTSSFPPLLRATSNLPNTPPPSTVDYSSPTSVFPAEACEVIGGEACDAKIYPEVKLKPEAPGNRPDRSSTEAVDREYLEYDGPKTVFPGEACDDLGGEFCEPEYQQGVFQEK